MRAARRRLARRDRLHDLRLLEEQDRGAERTGCLAWEGRRHDLQVRDSIGQRSPPYFAAQGLVDALAGAPDHEFGARPEFWTWLLLRARVWRSLDGALGGLYREGWLACLVSVRQFEGDWQGLRACGTVAEDFHTLEHLGAIDIYAAPTGLRDTLVHLGWWGCVTRDGESVVGPTPGYLAHLRRRAIESRGDHRPPAGVTRWEAIFADRVLAEVAESPAHDAPAEAVDNDSGDESGISPPSAIPDGG